MWRNLFFLLKCERKFFPWPFEIRCYFMVSVIKSQRIKEFIPSKQAYDVAWTCCNCSTPTVSAACRQIGALLTAYNFEYLLPLRVPPPFACSDANERHADSQQHLEVSFIVDQTLREPYGVISGTHTKIDSPVNRVLLTNCMRQLCPLGKKYSLLYKI